MPDAVPVFVDIRSPKSRLPISAVALTLIGNLLIELGSKGIRDEHVGGTRVHKRVEDDLEIILV